VKRLTGMLSLLVLAGALTMLAPAVALAISAGDQQYVDPLGPAGGGAGSSSHHSSSSGSSSSGSSSSGSIPAASPGSSSGTAVASAPTTTSSAPATTSAGPSSTSTSSSAATLPFTGFADWLSGSLGVLLLSAGLALRRVTRRA
jgi:hypothetical protein